MLSPGTKLGPYEILSPLGAGGMGEVYQAHDGRLGRIVAVKILNEKVSREADLRKRFQREARAISSLNHPHICAVYDIGVADDRDYLVMEYLEGETLAQKLATGELPYDSAVQFALHIASALDRAHRQGIVHRDLKPGNIMITRAGAKLLDFGLARLLSGDGETAPLTATDAFIGTVEYMAPEQVGGKAIDARTDIFAFGVLLYEMFAGTRPFAGGNRASVIGKILFEPPAPFPSEEVIPPALARLIDACLRKDPDERIQSAHDVLLQLQWIQAGTDRDVPRPFRLPRWVGRAALWTGLPALLFGLAFIGASRWSAAAGPQREIRFEISSPPGETIVWSVISPDGMRVAFVTEGRERERSLWVRDLHSTQARRLPGTDDVMHPFWSPESDAIAFFARQRLKTIHLNANSPQDLCGVDAPRGGSWSRHGVIIFTPHISTALHEIPATGGTPRPFLSLDKAKGDASQRWPVFLADGDQFLFVLHSSRVERAGLYLGSRSSKAIQRIMASPIRAVARGRSLLFVQAGRLFSQRFDVDTATVSGQPQLLAEKVWVDPKYTGGAAFSVSENGSLTYVIEPEQRRQISWFDAAGRKLGNVGPPGIYVNPALSPDGRQVALSRIDTQSGKNTLWSMDLATGVLSRLVVDDSNADAPIWSHDAKALYFSSDRTGSYDIYRKQVGADEPESLVYDAGTFAQILSARAEGILIHESDASGTPAVLYWPTGGKPEVLSVGATAEGQLALSPDSQWLAVVGRDAANSSHNIYAVATRRTGIRYQLTTDGGLAPSWSRDGKSMFYLTRDRRLWKVPFEPGRTFPPEPLFYLPVGDLVYGRPDYIAVNDGERFLVNAMLEPDSRSGAVVIVNWQR